MSHLSLDARAILEYLNECGYRNITAEQLKEFMKDLRKLIKYEDKLCDNVARGDHFDELFKRTTASFRAKADQQSNVPAKKNIDQTITQKQRSSTTQNLKSSSGHDKPQPVQQRPRSTSDADVLSEILNNVLNIPRPSKSMEYERHGNNVPPEKASGFGPTYRKSELLEKSEAKNLKTAIEKSTRRREPITTHGTGKPLPLKPSHDLNIQRKLSVANKIMWEIPNNDENRSRSKQRQTHDMRDSTQSDEGSDKLKAKSSSRMVPHYRSKGRPYRPRFNDPVSLYHWYQNEWKHFRKHIPGELTHANLRWNVRQKLLDPQPIIKTTKKCESDMKSRQHKPFTSESNFILK